ncbi:hypothetical protein B566_EDAN012813 [Ephemera danica]|nr:hypothetical protein B566_EDAN012813 [Ephemera danica]
MGAGSLNFNWETGNCQNVWSSKTYQRQASGEKKKQQHERYIGPAYDPSRDLSPNLPVHSSDSSSMGEGDVHGTSSSAGSTISSSNSSTCSHSTTSVDCSNNNNNNNNNSRVLLGASTTACCRVQGNSSSATLSVQQAYDYNKLQTASPSASTTTCKLEEDNNSVVMCAGCGSRIADRYFLQAIDRKWHASCLQCYQCRQTLDGEGTCFFREGNIYCKKDYYRYLEN